MTLGPITVFLKDKEKGDALGTENNAATK